MKKLLKRLCSAMVATVMVMTMAPAAFAADGGAQFQNGPYLLAPKTNSMVVVWESTEKVSATIAYGTDESKLCDPIKVEIDADAPDFKGSKMNLFHYKLDNLCVIVDNNNLQIDGPIGEVNSPYPIDDKFKAFNFHVINIDGHNFDEIRMALNEAKTIKGQPTAIIMKTVKGKGVSFMENNAGWHGSAPNDEQYAIAMADLEKVGEALCQK